MEHGLDVMTQGFRRLTDERILSMQPACLAVTRTRAPATFRDVVGQPRLPRGMKLDELAILNGVEVDAVIPAGTPLKLPS
jgi:predicted Zn-dependent protease